MRFRRSAIALAMLTLVLMPRDGMSQGTQSGEKRKTASLGQNYPNPFNPDAQIAFTVGGYPECESPTKKYRVTLKIFNVLAQNVGIPELRSGTSGVAGAGGQKVQNVQLQCGRYIAYWNGKNAITKREVASGLYIWTLDVDGKREDAIRSTVAK